MTHAPMHPGEVAIDADLVVGLLRDQFPSWAELPIRRVPSAGTDNALFRLGDDMVVRMPRIDWAVDAVAKEQRWLPHLARRVPIAVPEPLAMGVPGRGYPWHWSVYRWLEGDNADIDDLHDPESLALDVASFVTALWAVPPTPDAPPGRGVVLRSRDPETRSAIEALAGRADTDALTAAWEAALAIEDWTGPPTWTHGDVAPNNVLLVDGRLVAIIDFGTIGVGDRSIDLICAWNMLPRAVRPAFREALGVEDDEWARGRGFALSIALLQLPYDWDSNPALAGNARHVIAEVLLDHAETG